MLWFSKETRKLSCVLYMALDQLFSLWVSSPQKKKRSPSPVLGGLDEIQ